MGRRSSRTARSTDYGHPGIALEAFCTACADPLFVNCTVSGNEWDGGVCHGLQPGFFVNCILSSTWRSGAFLPIDDDGFNLSDRDPRFVREGVFDLRRWSTKAVAGRKIRAPDFDGRERPLCRRVDIGAYEFSDCEALAARFLRGDCGGDGSVDISDAVCELRWLFLEGAEPPCVAAVNTNGDAGVDVSDPVALLGHLFLAGPPPAGPFPACGAGDLPADDSLGCAVPPKGCP
jgi:hypothetical protein